MIAAAPRQNPEGERRRAAGESEAAREMRARRAVVSNVHRALLEMRAARLPVFATLAALAGATGLGPRLARAETSAPPIEAAARRPAPIAQPRMALPVAFGVSAPIGWLRGSIGGSVYVGIDRHVAVRANLARYDNGAPLLERLDGGGIHLGRIDDFGIGGVWYPRRLWEGLLLEAGALRRERDTHLLQESEPERKTRSTTLAGRAMIGWSWTLRPLFVAAAVGLSVGRETGGDATVPRFPGDMPVRRPIDRLQIDGELYLRIGLAIGG